MPIVLGLLFIFTKTEHKNEKSDFKEWFHGAFFGAAFLKTLEKNKEISSSIVVLCFCPPLAAAYFPQPSLLHLFQ